MWAQVKFQLHFEGWTNVLDAQRIARNCYTLRLPGNLELLSNQSMKSGGKLVCALGAAFFLTTNFSARAAENALAWPPLPDTNTQAFAGTAKYETTFDAPDATGKYFEINLGDVRQSARVKINGKDYGTLITPPFRVVVDNLNPTGNLLEVEVTSVAANRIRDLDRRGVPWKTFRDINIVDLNYKPFDASNWPLTDCGLLGPVTLTAVTPISLGK